MALSKEERCRELARLVGISLMDAEVTEVADRFESLMREAEERLFQVAHAYEQVTPWHTRRAPSAQG